MPTPGYVGGRSNDSTSAPVFIKETISRLRQAGADGEIVLRADSGFYLADVVTACRDSDVRFSITARMVGNAVKNTIAAIAEEDWTPIDYFLPGAGLAEFTFTPFATGHRGKQLAERGEIHPVRMIVRRTPITDAQAINRGQDPLFPIYDYHPMITDRTGDIVEVEANHRRHAEVELTIRDLKHGMGINHFPTKSFGANAAWLTLNTIAHNLTRSGHKTRPGHRSGDDEEDPPPDLQRHRPTGPHRPPTRPTPTPPMALGSPNRRRPQTAPSTPSRQRLTTTPPAHHDRGPGEAGQTGRTLLPTQLWPPPNAHRAPSKSHHQPNR